MEGPAKCGGNCGCQWFEDICFEGDTGCVSDGGCLTERWRSLDAEDTIPRPRRGEVPA